MAIHSSRFAECDFLGPPSCLSCLEDKHHCIGLVDVFYLSRTHNSETGEVLFESKLQTIPCGCPVCNGHPQVKIQPPHLWLSDDVSPHEPFGC